MATFQAKKIPTQIDVLLITNTMSTYWLWKALDMSVYKARIVVVDVNAAYRPPDRRTVPEQSAEWDGESDFFGASLAAIQQVASKHGYTLVYCEQHGHRCFYVLTSALLSIGSSEDVSSMAGPDWVNAVYQEPNYFGSGGGYKSSKQSQWQFV